jgi:prepilin-type N-terminal cleavage/methylation domain-containing protein
MRRRKGFTITELLVAMALIVFIMYILAEAFSAGSTAFRKLKAIGDMNEKLRVTSQVLRKYLQSDHFEDKKRVSDPDFWKDGPPRAGFLRIYNGSPFDYTTYPAYSNLNPNYYWEGTDLDGTDSFRAIDHGLHFSVKLRGNNRGDFFRAGLPANSPLLLLPLPDTRFQDPTIPSMASQWGEVAFFLVPTGDSTEDVESSAAPQPLYALYLRQRACVADNQDVTNANGGNRILWTPTNNPPNPGYPYYVEMSCHADPTSPPGPNAPPGPASTIYFNGPADLTMPARRLGGTPGVYQTGMPSDTAGTWPMSGLNGQYPILANEPGALLAGNDILLTNVLSFEVKVLLDRNQWNWYWTDLNLNLVPPKPVPPYDFVGLSHPAIQWFSNANPAFINATGPRVFDTWSQLKDDAYDYGAWQTSGATTSVPLFFNNPVNPTSTPSMKIRLVAVQITMRIWDPNTKQTRQSSVVVDL